MPVKGLEKEWSCPGRMGRAEGVGVVVRSQSLPGGEGEHRWG